VGLCANGEIDNIPISIRPSAAPDQFATILETLARVTAEPVGAMAQLLIPPHLNAAIGVTLLVITARLDETLRITLCDLHRRGRSLVVLCLAPEYVTVPAERIPLVRVPYHESWIGHDALFVGR